MYKTGGWYQKRAVGVGNGRIGIQNGQLVLKRGGWCLKRVVRCTKRAVGVKNGWLVSKTGSCWEYFTLPHTIRADPSKFGCIPSGIW